MAHSAPPLPVLAIVGHEPLDQSNGHISHPSLKSNLKHKSSLPPSLQGRDGSKSNRVRVRVSMPVRPEVAKAKGEEEEGPDSGAGDEAAVANHRQKKRERKVQWIDDCGKDLTQILEFEPRDTFGLSSPFIMNGAMRKKIMLGFAKNIMMKLESLQTALKIKLLLI
ncbi:hypothetical protein CY35_08G013900 [Sphagnum magellanicum]|nr:hypothetical protein CY35_08G013900 [Sphagnum magellanicum]